MEIIWGYQVPFPLIGTMRVNGLVRGWGVTLTASSALTPPWHRHWTVLQRSLLLCLVQGLVGKLPDAGVPIAAHKQAN